MEQTSTSGAEPKNTPAALHRDLHELAGMLRAAADDLDSWSRSAATTAGISYPLTMASILARVHAQSGAARKQAALVAHRAGVSPHRISTSSGVTSRTITSWVEQEPDA